MCTRALPRPHEQLQAISSETPAQDVLCGAQQIQVERAMPGQKVLWLLVTDNEQIRHAAVQYFLTWC